MDPKEQLDRLKAEVTADFNRMVETGEILADAIPTAQNAETPAAAAGATPAPETKEAGKTDKEPLIFGKYKTLEEAEKGYYNVLQYAKTATDKAKQFEMASQAGAGLPPLTPGTVPQVPGSSPGAAPRVNPAARSNVDWRKDDAVTKLAENSGIDPVYIADFAEALYRRAEESVGQRVQEQIAPFQAQAEAEAYMRTKHPEAYNFLPEIVAFIQTADPDIQDTVGTLMGVGKSKQAMEYAWTQFRANALNNVRSDMKANETVAEEGKKAAKSAARLPASSPGTPIHAADPSQNEPDPELMKGLLKKAQEGNYDAQLAYRRLTVNRILEQDPTFKRILDRNAEEYGLR